MPAATADTGHAEVTGVVSTASPGMPVQPSAQFLEAIEGEAGSTRRSGGRFLIPIRGLQARLCVTWLQWALETLANPRSLALLALADTFGDALSEHG